MLCYVGVINQLSYRKQGPHLIFKHFFCRKKPNVHGQLVVNVQHVLLQPDFLWGPPLRSRSWPHVRSSCREWHLEIPKAEENSRFFKGQSDDLRLS
jgi:hypothetical protein